MTKNLLKSIFAAVLLIPSGALNAADATAPQWNLKELSPAPATTEAQEVRVPGLQSLYVSGLPYQSRETKFYAYLGFPTNQTGKMPAVVLVHGGGGTAMAGWVQYWNAKGYVALSLDTEGHIPARDKIKKNEWQTIDSLKLPWVGGPQRAGAFDDCQQPLPDQWPYHAVADTVLSISLLASLPQVDAHQIGLVGISWGSVIGSLVGGVDQRLAFVVPQYIGGNLTLGNVWYGNLKNRPDALRWDPANFYRHPAGKAKWLWIDGINDKYGVPPMITQSWHDTAPDSWMTFLPTQGHGHAWGETGKDALREIYVFADSVTRGTPPLARILRTIPGKGEVALVWQADKPIRHAQLSFTLEPIPLITVAGESRKDWSKIKYTVQDLPLPAVKTHPDGSMQASFPLPAGMKAGILNLIDERGLTVSGDFLNFD